MLSYEQRISILHSVKSAVKEDPTILSEIVLTMNQSLIEENDRLREQASGMEMIAVAMHSKAGDSRHTSKSKEWVDGIIKKHGEKYKDHQFTAADFPEDLK